MIYPLLRPAIEELFEKFEPAFLANAAYRFRDRRQLWTISAHDHLPLKTNPARAVKSHGSAHLSVRYCLSASPDALEARLKTLADGTVQMACYQSPRGGCWQGARCDALSVGGDRACRSIRKEVL